MSIELKNLLNMLRWENLEKDIQEWRAIDEFYIYYIYGIKKDNTKTGRHRLSSFLLTLIKCIINKTVYSMDQHIEKDSLLIFKDQNPSNKEIAEFINDHLEEISTNILGMMNLFLSYEQDKYGERHFTTKEVEEFMSSAKQIMNLKDQIYYLINIKNVDKNIYENS